MPVRVFELARDLGISSTDLIEKCHAAGFDVEGHMTIFDNHQARLVRAMFPRPSSEEIASRESAKEERKRKVAELMAAREANGKIEEEKSAEAAAPQLSSVEKADPVAPQVVPSDTEKQGEAKVSEELPNAEPQETKGEEATPSEKEQPAVWHSGFADLKWLVKAAWSTAIVTAALLSFMVLVEILRAFIILKSAHWLLGYAFLVAVAGLVLGVAWLMSRLFAGRPTVLSPPDVEDIEAANETQVRACAQYLVLYLRRLGENERLKPEGRSTARQVADGLEAELAAGASGAFGDLNQARQLLQKTGTETVEPLLEELDAMADGEIARSVGQIMLFVALSPYQSVDLLIALYRSGVMITRISRIYNSRPQIRELLLTYWNVVQIAAMVNVTNVLGRVAEKVAKAGAVALKTITAGIVDLVPLTKYVDELAQAFGVGVIASVAGHAAKDRCRAYIGWSVAASRKRIWWHIQHFLRDLYNCFDEYVMKHTRERFGIVYEKVRTEVLAVIEKTEAKDVIKEDKLKPTVARRALAAGLGLVGTAASTVSAGGRKVGRATARAGGAVANAFKWIFSRKKKAGKAADNVEVPSADTQKGNDKPSR